MNNSPALVPPKANINSQRASEGPSDNSSPAPAVTIKLSKIEAVAVLASKYQNDLLCINR